MKQRVLLVPPPHAYGSISMNRYHQSLTRVYDDREHKNIDVKSLVSPVNELPRRKSFSRRFLSRYIITPLRCCLSRKINIYHALSEDAGELLKWIPDNSKAVATVHDIIPLYFDQGLNEKQLERYERQIKRLTSFDAVICVSQYTADCLASFIDIDPSKIHVSPNGVDAKYFSKPFGRQKAVSNRKYILSISNNAPRKNLEILPELFAGLNHQHEDLYLVRIGSPLNDELRMKWNQLVGAQKLIEVEFCSDEELVSYYQHAECFVFPSLAEGFGLPLLEAMASSCPVVCSNVTSLPEVGGEYAFYFDPENIEEAIQATETAMIHKNDMKFINRAKLHAESFSWEQHAKSIVQIYNSLA